MRILMSSTERYTVCQFCGTHIAYEQKDVSPMTINSGTIVCPFCAQKIPVNSWFENESANIGFDM